MRCCTCCRCVWVLVCVRVEGWAGCREGGALSTRRAALAVGCVGCAPSYLSQFNLPFPLLPPHPTPPCAQALQYVQANPDEVCPAGWKPGDKTMKPEPEGSKEYFAAI